MSAFVLETKAQLIRWLLHLKREPYNVGLSLVNPAILLIFMGGAFRYVARDPAVGADYRAFLLPGVLALTAFGNSMAGGIPLLFDKENGFLRRLLTAPISRVSVILSRFLAVNVGTLLQCVAVLLLGRLFGVGVAAGAAGIGALLAICLLLSFSVTVVSLVLAFVLERHGDFFAILGVTALPLTFLSSAFVPLDQLPAWMRLCAYLNPMTYAIEAMRSLIVFGWDGWELWRAVVVLGILDAVVCWRGTVVIQRRLA
jgi:ABC-2 type transport system permease protein